MTNESGPQFVYAIYIATTPEKLWEALTSAKFTEQYFFGRSIASDWHVGSPIVFRTHDGQLDVEGTVLICDPPRLLSCTWTSTIDHTPHETPTRVTFELNPMGSVVKLTIIHDNLLESDYIVDRNTFNGLNNGWPAILSNLKTFLEVA